MRERHTLLTTVAGLVVTAAAVTVSLKAGDRLPQEPAPVTALALSVLVGSAIRTLPAGLLHRIDNRASAGPPAPQESWTKPAAVVARPET